MNKFDITQILDAALAEVQAELETTVPKGYSTPIHAARLAKEVLAYFGIEALPVAVRVGILNKVAWKQYELGHHPGGRAHAVFVGGDTEEPLCVADGYYRGHLVLKCGETILDPSLFQFSVPNRGLPLSATRFHAPKWDLEQGAKFSLPNGTRLIYIAESDRTFQRTPAWKADSSLRQIAGRIIRNMKGKELAA